MSAAWQASLLDTGDDIALHELGSGLHRTELSRGAWVDYRPGWLGGADRLFDELHHDVPWHAERREMYERIVDVPRLLKFYDEDEVLPHPVLTQAREELSRLVCRGAGRALRHRRHVPLPRRSRLGRVAR